MKMYNPPHPGMVLKEMTLDPLDLSIADAARALGISRKHLSNIVNCKVPITAEVATRLKLAFGGTAEIWLRMQMAHDLWHLEQREKELKVKRIAA